jgi:hypothetical protein
MIARMLTRMQEVALDAASRGELQREVGTNRFMRKDGSAWVRVTRPTVARLEALNLIEWDGRVARLTNSDRSLSDTLSGLGERRTVEDVLGELGGFDEDEAAAVVSYLDREIWVWGKILEHAKSSEDRERYERIVEETKRRRRLWAEIAALEQQAQTDYEVEHGVTEAHLD